MDGACLFVVIMPDVVAVGVRRMADEFQRVYAYTCRSRLSTLAQHVRLLAAVLIPAPAYRTMGDPPAVTPNLTSYFHEHTSRQTSEHLSLLGTILIAAQ